jgi:hypothetical protein
MNTSDQINEIAAAMAKAQANIQNPAKDKVNPHFKSKYADLAAGLDCIRPALSGNGIAIFQATEVVDDGVILKTRLVHTSGQWVESAYPVSKFAKHQEMGAALTYAKRQALFSLVGVCGDEDDDGNIAQKVDTRPAPKVVEPTRITADDSLRLLGVMKDTLAMCESRESLSLWVKANKDAKAQLLPDDQDDITDAYNRRAAELARPSTPPAQAAE